jgi:hypothetical protein
MAGNDTVWRHVYARVMALSKLELNVGVLVSKGGARSVGDDLTLVELAAIHEFGSPAANIPERSFIRRTFYERVPNELRVVCGRIAKAITLGAMGARQGMNTLGAWAAAQVKNTITQTDIPPPLASETVNRKGSSKPLVDTGQMLNAISWEVVDEQVRK